MRFADSLKHRVPWSVGHEILHTHNLPTGRGWDHTVEKLKELKGSEDTFTKSNIESAIKQYSEHVLSGEKTVRLFDVPDDKRKTLIDSIKSIPRPDNLFAQAYPFILTETELNQITQPHAHIASIQEYETGIAVVFASKREAQFREHIQRNEFDETIAEQFPDADELIAVRTSVRQSFDIFWVPYNAEYVEVRADSPIDAPSEYATLAHNHLKGQIYANIMAGTYLDEPINLFPLIRAMYSDGNEGTVVEMAFSTQTASLKDEKMRKKRLDLRTELYHQAGAKALGNQIAPYRISVAWNRGRKKATLHPEAQLNARFYDLQATTPKLFSTTIRKCIDSDDYNYVLSRLKAHL